jgi:hypothetical protein
VYKFAKLAGGKMPKREIKPIVAVTVSEVVRPSQGVMGQSELDLVTVVFQCDARGMYVRNHLSIVGNLEELGNWTPNVVRLYDDGTHGDIEAGDSIWTIEFALPVGIKIEYKFTNSGAEGSWNPGEEFPGEKRKILVERTETGKMVLLDKFGQI